MRDEIEEAERREEDWDRFYEAKRKEMEEFQAVAQRFEAETREEVQRLRNLVSQVWSQPNPMHPYNYELITVPSLFSLNATGDIGIWVKLGRLLILFTWACSNQMATGQGCLIGFGL